jgi:glycosyltransferase involved in cell wall biosynthesis
LLSRRKGHDVLIDALHRIADLPWQAEIIGRYQDPAYVAALEAQIAQADLTSRITLRGEVEEEALRAAYLSASLFALATRYEGYGMVLSEAMLHGLPVVSCAVGAVPGTVGDAGDLVPADDPAAFAAALRRLLEQPEDAARLARASGARAAQLPTWADTAQHFATVIAQVTP